MFKRILVPLDGSERAERAIPVAVRLAHASQGTIILGRAVHVQASIAPYGELPLDVRQDALKARAAEAAAYLASATKRAGLEGIAVETTVRTGPAAWEMLTAAQEKAADLIVICSHGHTGFKRWVLGSVAQQMIRHAQEPVLILREQGTALVPASTNTRLDSSVGIRVLVALDGSARALAVLAPAMSLAQELSPTGRCALHLLFVVNPHEMIDNDLPRETARKTAQSYLATIAEQLRNEYNTDTTLTAPVVTWSVMTDSDTAAAIIQVAENGEASGAGGAGAPVVGYDVIAMATHGRTGVALWALGSVTGRIVQSTQLPMLIVRASEKPADKTSPVHLPPIEDTIATWPGLL
jgi:nucleotide-binding universal stress UspA family protein